MDEPLLRVTVRCKELPEDPVYLGIQRDQERSSVSARGRADRRTSSGPRLKIRLGHLTWSGIRRSIASGEPLIVRLRLTDAKGGPLCATPPSSRIRWERA
jgi:hypothetical protein